MKLEFPGDLTRQEFESANTLDGLQVYLADEHDYPSMDCAGLYYPGDKLPISSEFVNSAIVIRSDLANRQKVYILYHELAHHYCYVGGCYCWSIDKDQSVREYHAILYSTRHLLKKYKLDKRYFPCLYAPMRTMLHWLMSPKKLEEEKIISIYKNEEDYEYAKYYHKAMKKMIKTITWQKYAAVLKDEMAAFLKKIKYRDAILKELNKIKSS